MMTRTQKLPHSSLADQLVQLSIAVHVCLEFSERFHLCCLQSVAIIAREAVLLEAGLTELADVFGFGLLVLGFEELELLAKLFFVRYRLPDGVLFRQDLESFLFPDVERLPNRIAAPHEGHRPIHNPDPDLVLVLLLRPYDLAMEVLTDEAESLYGLLLDELALNWVGILCQA